jgi:type I restriction enzyme S subunit
VNQIEELIEKLCPNGIRFIPLDMVASVSTGDQLNKELLSQTGKYPVMNGGISPSGFYDDFNNEAKTTVISQGGASAGFVTWMDSKFWAGAHLFVIKPNLDLINARYLHQYIKAKENEIQSMKTGAGIPGLNRSKLIELWVPVPPIEIQNEIVKILDTFTDLEAELEAEFTARSKQYAFYSKSLINDSSNGDPLMLEVFCEYRKERLVNSLNPMPYIGVEDLRQDKKGIYNSWQSKIVKSAPIYRTKDILLGNIRPYLKKVWFAEFDGITNGDVLILKIKDDFVEKVLPEFLYFVLSSDDFFEYNVQYSKGAKMPRGDKDAILKYRTSLPDIPTQMNIVKILNSFKDLLTDANFGIPAEIAARRKQYEYYLQQLLTFEELESA